VARVPPPWTEEAFVSMPPSLARALGVSPWVVIGVALTLVVLGLARMSPVPAQGRRWRWTTTGLLLGALGVLAWLTGAPSGWHWGLSMTGPARSLLEILGGDGGALSWGTMMLIGVPLGTWLSARCQGPVRWRRPPWADLTRRSSGGILMGVGGTLAAGCNIGNALTGLSILAVNSVIATIAIVAGGAAAIVVGTVVAAREAVNAPRAPDRRSP